MFDHRRNPEAKFKKKKKGFPFAWNIVAATPEQWWMECIQNQSIICTSASQWFVFISLTHSPAGAARPVICSQRALWGFKWLVRWHFLILSERAGNTGGIELHLTRVFLAARGSEMLPTRFNQNSHHSHNVSRIKNCLYWYCWSQLRDCKDVRKISLKLLKKSLKKM